MINYYTQKTEDRAKERIKEAEQHYHNRIIEGVIILVTGMVIVVTFCVVLF